MLLNQNVYEEISHIIRQGKQKVFQAVNSEMLFTYWEIGRKIFEEEQKGENRAEYGKFLIKNLSERLTEDFGKGFTETNLKYMRQFYQRFQNRHAVRDQLSWTHYRLILRVEEEDARNFYIAESIENNWSTRQLERQINSFYYNRILASQDKNLLKAEADNTSKQLKPTDLIKDPYVLEFLELKENANYLERDLEKSILSKLQEFLLELGKGFSFVAR